MLFTVGATNDWRRCARRGRDEELVVQALANGLGRYCRVVAWASNLELEEIQPANNIHVNDVIQFKENYC